ncbi:helix-turn-helix domain-containing protein [Nocardia seriolae]|nr:helix-turn-helix domain-containing protein [Nocardia seriolae]WKY52241.1 helix-turn-helix domain-containing protein [Nocardia seriolae]
MAARLGFADDRALRKAYRRWHGTSPTGLAHADRSVASRDLGADPHRP